MSESSDEEVYFSSEEYLEISEASSLPSLIEESKMILTQLENVMTKLKTALLKCKSQTGKFKTEKLISTTFFSNPSDLSLGNQHSFKKVTEISAVEKIQNILENYSCPEYILKSQRQQETFSRICKAFREDFSIFAPVSKFPRQ